MPDFPTLTVFLNDSRESRVTSRQLKHPLELGELHTIDKLSSFTFRVFRDVFGKKFEEDATQLSYWLAPANNVFTEAHKIAPQEALDWPLLDSVYQNDEFPWTPDTPAASLIGRYLIDRWDGGRKYFSVGIAQALSPLDPYPIPEHVSKTARTNGDNSIIGFTVSLWKKVISPSITCSREAIAMTLLTLYSPEGEQSGILDNQSWKRRNFRCA